MKLLNQGHHAIDRVAFAQPVHEVLHACVNDDFGLGNRGAPAVLAGLHHLRQVVYGVQIHILQRLDLKFNIARHRQVHHEHGPVFAAL